MAAWWGLTLLFASQVEICIPDCSGSSQGPETALSWALLVDRAQSGGNAAAALGLCLFFGELLFQLQRSLPTLPCLQPASARLLISFSVPFPLLPPACTYRGSWQVPQPCPCCSVFPCLSFPYSSHSLTPIPCTSCIESLPRAPRRPGPALARGAPGGSLRGRSAAAGATGVEGRN